MPPDDPSLGCGPMRQLPPAVPLPLRQRLCPQFKPRMFERSGGRDATIRIALQQPPKKIFRLRRYAPPKRMRVPKPNTCSGSKPCWMASNNSSSSPPLKGGTLPAANASAHPTTKGHTPSTRHHGANSRPCRSTGLAAAAIHEHSGAMAYAVPTSSRGALFGRHVRGFRRGFGCVRGSSCRRGGGCAPDPPCARAREIAQEFLHGFRAGSFDAEAGALPLRSWAWPLSSLPPASPPLPPALPPMPLSGWTRE